MAKRNLDWEDDAMRDMRTREAIRQDIIKQMWDLWATFTFFGVVGKLEAESIIRKFFDNINRTAGMQLVDRGICLYVCYEKHTDKPGVHIHAFIRGINPIHAELLQNLATSMVGNSKVTPYNDSQNAAAYVANKYKTPSFVDNDRVVIIHPKKFHSSVDEKSTVAI